jgi:hypothetical protein
MTKPVIVACIQTPMFEVRALSKSSRKDRIERGAAQEGPGCRGRSLPGANVWVVSRPGPLRTDARKFEYLSGPAPVRPREAGSGAARASGSPGVSFSAWLAAGGSRPGPGPWARACDGRL